MTKQEMWEVIKKEDKLKKENEENIQKTKQRIKEIKQQLELAIKAKDSSTAVKLTDQLETEKRHLEIYNDVISSFKNEGANISKEEFMKGYAKEVSEPYYKRQKELVASLMEQRQVYIDAMKAAYKELVELSNREREFWDINSKGKLDIEIPTFYPKNAFSECFINESRYFFD